MTAFIPQIFVSGEAYQFDWSHEHVELGGVDRVVEVAHVRLCHSRALFLAAIYTLVGFHGSPPFVAAAAAMAVGLVRLLLLRGAEGNVIVGGEKRLWATARVVPLLLAISVIAGMLETVPWGVYQVYALNSGVSVRTAGLVRFAGFSDSQGGHIGSPKSR